MKILVIEDSKYGTSRRYAQWIAQQTEAQLLNRRQVQPEHLAEADILVYGAGVYAGVLSGGKWLASQQELLADKKLAIFTSSGAEPYVAPADDGAGGDFCAEGRYGLQQNVKQTSGHDGWAAAFFVGKREKTAVACGSNDVGQLWETFGFGR